MLAGHLPFTYTHDHAWAVLVALMAVGAAIRHYFIRRHAGRDALVDPGRLRLRDRGDRRLAPAVRDEARGRRGRRCRSPRRARSSRRGAPRATRCTRPSPGSTRRRPASSSTRPSRSTRSASQIKAVAVDSTFMPLGNATQHDRRGARALGQWIAAGCEDPAVIRDHRRRLRAHRPPRGGALAAHGRVLPDDAPVREQADPGALVGPGGVDPDGRLRRRRPRARGSDQLPGAGRAAPLPGRGQRGRDPLPVRRHLLREQGRPARGQPLRDRRRRASSTCRRSASSCSGREPGHPLLRERA